MSLARQLKLAVLESANRTGVAALFGTSSWRQSRLLIVCWHGISLDDEHLWNPGLYITEQQFQSRLKILRDVKCNVLGLEEGLIRLREGTLPPRSVVLTVDDGSYDFYLRGFPVIRKYGFPLTVYLTTYYSEYNRPVFDTMASYLLWKSGGPLVWPELLQSPADLSDEVQRNSADRQIKEYALAHRLSGSQKDALLEQLASRLQIDYSDLRRRRLLHLVTPAEASVMSDAGVDLQLHTHRHRVYLEEDYFHSELDDNVARIRAIAPNGSPKHFCYTGGFYAPEFPRILKNYGLKSATTCELGLASAESNPFLLPRLLDHANLSDTEFRSWLMGVADLFPRRQYPMTEGQLMKPNWNSAPDKASA